MRTEEESGLQYDDPDRSITTLDVDKIVTSLELHMMSNGLLFTFAEALRPMIDEMITAFVQRRLYGDDNELQLEAVQPKASVQQDGTLPNGKRARHTDVPLVNNTDDTGSS